MAEGNFPLYGFNRGLISQKALARTDLKRTALSAEIMENWMPRVLGSMMLRPGLAYKAETLSDLACQPIPFIFSATDTAYIELTDQNMRVLISDTPITRVSVATAITNGFFNADLSSWTDADETGAASTWLTGGWMQLLGTGVNRAIRRQTVTVAGGDLGKEHALELHVRWGPVTLKVGTADDDDTYINETDLAAGYHSLAFTPAGDIHIQFASPHSYPSLLDYVKIAAAGVMLVPTQITAAMLPTVRWAQSADVLFLAVSSIRQQKIERRTTRSWSVVDYQPVDGPFDLPNLDLGATITPSATMGQITLTASRPIFSQHDADDNGPLLRLVSTGQDVTTTLGGLNQFTDPPVKVTGLSANNAREINIDISGTFVGTVQLQRSVGEVGSWANVKGKSWTGNVSTTYDDGLDNQIVYYRLIFSAYTSGSAVCEISFSGGSITGIVRCDVFTDSTHITAEVLKPLGGTDPTSIWSRSSWSQRSDKGFPTAVGFYEGRLFWGGRSGIWGSVSDAYASFDDTVVGDSGPINRTIAGASVDTVNWLLPLQRLIAGTAAAENAIRSSSLDEPLTPTNFNIKAASTQGSAPIAALRIDNNGVYIQKSGRRLMQLAYNWTLNAVDYVSSDLTIMDPDLGIESNFVEIAVQRQPDTRIHLVQADGSVVVLVFDAAEDVQCLLDVTTDGVIEHAFVLPSDIEDAVYYVVRRTINGVTKRYYERWAREDECLGAALTKCADSHIVYSGSPTATITGLSTLEAKTVVVWADGRDRGTFTVASGAITLPVAVSNACVGLPYSAPWKSAKLAYAAQMGTALTQKKRVAGIALIMQNAHAQGLQYGSDADHLDPMPLIEDGAPVDQNSIWQAYDHEVMPFDGDWDTDSRIFLLAAAPRPVTIMAAVIAMETREKVG